MDKEDDDVERASLNYPLSEISGGGTGRCFAVVLVNHLYILSFNHLFIIILEDDELAAIASEAVELEKEFKRKMEEFEENERRKEEERRIEEEGRRKASENESKEAEIKWQIIQEKLQKEKESIETQKKQIEEQHNKRMVEQQRCIDRNLEILKINLEIFTNEFETEKQNLMRYEVEKQVNSSKKQINAATQIQRYYRGYAYVPTYPYSYPA